MTQGSRQCKQERSKDAGRLLRETELSNSSLLTLDNSDLICSTNSLGFFERHARDSRMLYVEVLFERN